MLKIVPSVGFAVVGVLTAPCVASTNTYAPGSLLSISIVCPNAPAADPVFSVVLHNRGTSTVEVDQQIPIALMVDLTVKDAEGNTITPRQVIGPSRRPVPSRFLKPGASLTLMDWVDAQPLSTLIPLHLFGYTLDPGTYRVSATATESPDEPTSNVCTVIVN